jgi:hypothetical protein
VAPQDSVDSKEHALMVGAGVGVCARANVVIAHDQGGSDDGASSSSAPIRRIIIIRHCIAPMLLPNPFSD